MAIPVPIHADIAYGASANFCIFKKVDLPQGAFLRGCL
jgi:hypothetical protein